MSEEGRSTRSPQLILGAAVVALVAGVVAVLLVVLLVHDVLGV
jgi:hypothetical protein